MAFSSILKLSLIISIISVSFASPVSKCTTKNTLITKQCIRTHFPGLCCKTISPFAKTIKNNPRALCKVGIVASISSNDRVLTLLQNVSFVDGDGISWCKSDFGRSMNEIQEALEQYNANVKVNDVAIFKDAVLIYVLGALSDEELCLERLRNEGVKNDQKEVYGAIVTAVKLKKITASFINHL